MADLFGQALDFLRKAFATTASLAGKFGSVAQKLGPRKGKKHGESGKEDPFGIPEVDGILEGSIQSRKPVKPQAAAARAGISERLSASGKAVSDAVGRNPMLLIVPAVIAVIVGVCIVIVMISYIPPKPISGGGGTADPRTRKILESLVVPFDDPLDPGWPLDRAPKTRYNRSDVEKKWIDVGGMDVSGSRKRNIEELDALFSGIE
ncbi:MAG: hypothetical protein NT080_05095 [Spirochaetes bacterium]|nr:hypothetical protein [Spirochaetota bacterium]